MAVTILGVFLLTSHVLLLIHSTYPGCPKIAWSSCDAAAALATHEYCGRQQRLSTLVTALIKLLFVSGNELDCFSGALEVVSSRLFVLSYSPN